MMHKTKIFAVVFSCLLVVFAGCERDDEMAPVAAADGTTETGSTFMKNGQNRGEGGDEAENSGVVYTMTNAVSGNSVMAFPLRRAFRRPLAGTP